MGFHAQAFLIGGGGGSSSAADILGRIGYTFTKHLSAYAGYRYLKVDYKNKDFIYDVEMQGPMISRTYKF
jgi:predicted porin